MKKSQSITSPSGSFKQKVVLDTSTLLDDPLIFQSFKKSDVYIPFAVLEEMDSFKKRYRGKKGLVHENSIVSWIN